LPAALRHACLYHSPPPLPSLPWLNSSGFWMAPLHSSIRAAPPRWMHMDFRHGRRTRARNLPRTTLCRYRWPRTCRYTYRVMPQVHLALLSLHSTPSTIRRVLLDSACLQYLTAQQRARLRTNRTWNLWFFTHHQHPPSPPRWRDFRRLLLTRRLRGLPFTGLSIPGGSEPHFRACLTLFTPPSRLPGTEHKTASNPTHGAVQRSVRDALFGGTGLEQNIRPGSLHVTTRAGCTVIHVLPFRYLSGVIRRY